MDRPLLSSTDGTWATARNHRRRLTATALVAVKIRFTGSSVQGPQNLLIVEDYKCDAGCTPKLTGNPILYPEVLRELPQPILNFTLNLDSFTISGFTIIIMKFF